MNIGHVNGNGGIERGAERPGRTENRRSGAPERSHVHDQAAISAGGRETAASVEALAERSRDAGEPREEKVRRAVSRLMNGELDREAVHADVAQRLLQSDFLGA